MWGQENVPCNIVPIADIEDPFNGGIAKVTKQQRTAYGSTTVKRNLKSNARIVSLTATIILKRCVDEGPESVTIVCTVQFSNGVSRNSQTINRKAVVVVFLEHLVI